jgi:heme exporter protein B
MFYLKILFNDLTSILSPIYFAILLLITFQIAVGPHKIDIDTTLGITFSAIILSIIMSADKLIQKDKKDGMLEMIYISGLSPYWFIITKLILFALVALFIAIAVLIATSLMFSIRYEFFLEMVWPVIVLIPTVSVIVLFISLITLGFPSKLAQYILSLPLILPALIFSAGAISNPTYFALAIGLNFIYVPMFIVFSRMILGLVVARLR